MNEWMRLNENDSVQSYWEIIDWLMQGIIPLKYQECDFRFFTELEVNLSTNMFVFQKYYFKSALVVSADLK